MNQVKDYLNRPVRNCKNCVHSERGLFGRLCIRGGYSCEMMRAIPDYNCDENMSGWQPKPQRKSLRQWLYDLIWK